jgi:hypothetical protein
MQKAARKHTTPPKQSHDAGLIAMVNNHGKAFALWGRLAEQNEKDSRIDALITRCCELEPIIVATPVRTKAGLAAKRRMIAKVGYVSVNGNPDLATGNVAELVEVILTLDAERVAAAAT